MSAPQPAVTPRQLRCIHVLLRRTGVAKEDVRAMYHVGTLKQLSRADAAMLIDRLRGHPRAGRPSGPRLVNTPHGDATQRQRDKIWSLFCALGWPHARRVHWLRARHGIASVYEDDPDRPFTIGQAHQIISELEAAAARGPGGRTTRETP